jgi:hypothetical protein
MLYIYQRKFAVTMKEMDGWPSGLRRCLKEFVPAVFGRGFESHFIQYFSFLLQLFVYFVVVHLTY